MKIATLVVGPIEENCYIVFNEDSKNAVIIDPGDDAPSILDCIHENGLHPQMICNTHGHNDHVGAVAALKQEFDIPFCLHPLDEEWLHAPLADMLQLAGGRGLTIDHALADGQVLQGADTTIQIIHTPGHTRGGCVLYFPNENVAFTGDTLFKGTVGRTDFPGGSFEAICDSVQNKLKTLPDDCVLYPGHGPKTNMGFERAHNPYVRG
jgi:hydroxyacylglutathione hydrolase